MPANFSIKLLAIFFREHCGLERYLFGKFHKISCLGDDFWQNLKVIFGIDLAGNFLRDLFSAIIGNEAPNHELVFFQNFLVSDEVFSSEPFLGGR